MQEETEFQYNKFAAELITSVELQEPLEGTFEGACFTHNDDSWHELTHIVFSEDTNAIESLKLSVTWKDQGEGTSKGCLKVVLVNGPDEVISEEVFGMAPHHWQDQEIEFSASSRLVNSFSRSDSYRVYYKVGSGGSNKLFIKQFSYRADYE